MRKTKDFDCVAMKHRGGDRIYEAIKDMTSEQRKAYWEERNREAREMMRQASARRKPA